MLTEKLLEHPIIAAIQSNDIYEESLCKVYFILGGTINDLETCISKLKNMNKLVFVHMDLIKGLRSDHEGVRFVASLGADGIITTHGQLIEVAKKEAIMSVLRLFLLDSKNLQSGIKTVGKYKPDAVEVLPGAMHKVTSMIVESTQCPVITGGLILDKEDIIECLKSGAIGVSTSSKKLWAI